MEIRKATIRDAEKILKLQKVAYLSEAEIYDDYNIPPLLQTLDELKNEFNSFIFLKAIKDNRIIGSVKAYQRNETCHIGRLIVDTESQNIGIGTKLMKKIEDYFDTVHRYELFTGKKSIKNLHFYSKLGYKIFKEEKLSENTWIVYLEKIHN